MDTRRPLTAAVFAAALISVTTACGGAAAPAPAAADQPAPTTAASSVDTACTNLLGIDATPTPEEGPESPPAPEEVKAWGATITTMLDAALAAAPPELTPSLTALQPFVQTAANDGVLPAFDDPGLNAALAGYETWAHDNCGYQNIDLVGRDFEFTGAPATLEPGPISVLMENRSEDEQFHVALLARAKDPAMTAEQFTAMPMEELFGAVDLVPGAAAAAPGQTGGTLADLEPGTYFLFCPVGDEGEIPHHLQGMITTITVA
ncbi:hypothetical protein [Pseudonocardia broussonetiae]|uniref:Lipoprotein n=1 Tax=Pseudonocardia broussonetiae TaxID=2736640 RepID=A0A6M6JHN8_9PSEU|nr:hypothetical protein [Pseudonocardia broussonetiae]QJY46956.1 hypothetical protein HOP40_14950 [Pseudonocardia broussonetiae]